MIVRVVWNTEAKSCSCFWSSPQRAHSIEEYVTRLYQVFDPARFVSSLVSNSLALGFPVVSVALVAFGLWCWAVPVRSGWPAARGFAWFWTILELGNGLGHSGLALRQGSYFPDLITAPLLLLFRFVASGFANSSPKARPSAALFGSFDP